MKLDTKVQARSALQSLTGGGRSEVASPASRGADPLARHADALSGRSALKDGLSESGGLDQMLGGASLDGEAGNSRTAPEVGGAGSDPLRWVLGHQAPSVGDLRMFTRDVIKEAKVAYKQAPKSKESDALLDATHRLENELGQFGALTSLAKLGGNWNWAGIHASGQLLEALALINQVLPESVKKRGKNLPIRAQEYLDRMRAGRQNFYSRNVPAAKAGMMGNRSLES